MAGLPSQNVFKALMYTGRIFLILMLAGMRTRASRRRSPNARETEGLA